MYFSVLLQLSTHHLVVVICLLLEDQLVQDTYQDSCKAHAANGNKLVMLTVLSYILQENDNAAVE